MALQISYKTQFGLTIQTGYFKISSVSIDAEKNKVRFSGNLYFNADARVNKDKPIIPQIFTYEFDDLDLNANLREQIYARCKEEGIKVKNEIEGWIPAFYIFVDAMDA